MIKKLSAISLTLLSLSLSYANAATYVHFGNGCCCHLPVSLVFKGAWGFGPRPSVINTNFSVFPGANTSTVASSGAPLNVLYLAGLNQVNLLRLNNFNNSSTYNTFSPGAEVWLGLFRAPSILLNGVVFGNFIAQPNVTVTGNVVQTNTTFNNPNLVGQPIVIGGRVIGVVPAIANQNTFNQFYKYQIESSRSNLGLGINAIYDLYNNWFIEGMLGGGISRFHASASFTQITNSSSIINPTSTTTFNVSSTNTSTAVFGSDHPGVCIYRPFLQGEIGFGRRLTNQTKAYVFLNGASTFNNSTVILNSGSSNTFGVNINVPSHWYSTGLGITYDIV